MQIKNKKNIIILYFLILFFSSLNLNAEEFNISAKEILINKDEEIIVGKGSVVAKDTEGQIIYADKITYEKSREFLLAEGGVKIEDNEGNILETEKATYDKLKEKIVTYNKTELILKDGYNLVAKNISYNTIEKIINSNENSVFTDIDGNVIESTMFQYDIINHLFSSVGKIKITDINKNKYFFKEIYIDTNKREMIGSDISVVLDQNNFGVSEKNDPRFVSNNVFASQDKIKLSKGVFTVCRKREGKCPPWSIKAKEILYDKAKKNIYYEHAVLKIYDIPIFYFPKFFHPDPTVKRQSGFLFPFFTNSTTMGNGFATPYYFAINDDKDFTFTPKFYTSDNPLFLNEYRQAFEKGFLTFDTGYTEGYKNLSATKLDGSQSHIFADLNLNLNEDSSYESNLSLILQRTSNDTYFRKHSINTALVDSEDTNLRNQIKYSFSNNDSYFSLTGSIYENLREKNNKRYEYMLPNILYGKTFFTEKFGEINFKSDAFYNNYDVNKHKAFLTNDIIWKPSSKFSKNGFVNTWEGMLRNTNYEARKTEEYKSENTVNELHGVLSYKSSLPLKKDGINYSNYLSPNFMLRYAPGHMRNLREKDVALSRTNLYSLNKTSEIESGLSAVLGFDFKINENDSGNRERLSFSLGQVFTDKVNNNMPSKSSLGQKMSDVVGEINYNFSEIGKIDYNFLVDHNFNNLNYQEVSTELNFGKVKFNLDYLEENNHSGSEHYASPGISIDFNEQNNLSFSTKKNFKTDSTELYDLTYQYQIDCLTAGLVYRRKFYEDSDLQPNDTLMFAITFVPFGTVNTPTKN